VVTEFLQVGPEGLVLGVRLYQREVLDVDLVDDAGARRHDLEHVEAALAPAQELVMLPAALVLDLDIARERPGPAEHVDDHGAIDHQLRGSQGVHRLRVGAELGDRLAHGGQVHDALISLQAI
jgi:hypothetical protein